MTISSVFRPYSQAERVQIGSAKHLGPHISDDGLCVLRKLGNLRRLTLVGLSGTTDECLAHLNGLQELEYFCAADVRWGGKGFVHLTNLRLTEVSLNAWPASDECLVHLGRIPTLKTLYLGRTQITDAGLAHLRQLHDLEELNIGNTQIGDEGIRHLFGLKKLHDLEAFKTNVTVSSAAPLAAALPRCRITTRFGAYEAQDGRNWAWHMFQKPTKSADQ